MRFAKNNRLLGLSFEGRHVAGAVARRVSGGVEIQQAFLTPALLDPLSSDPELAGRAL